MKLKKLELFGFKSFVDKVGIGFPPGVSAIVGPNGCGKSNIVDALRWVMGEQSVKQLRGKAMEDVIFAGADGKPPLNMAEVSLTMMNNNGSAPEEFRDYTEIQVTRRLYRSGESAYFINRQPCRLKDIHNLFMGSGMGAKTYAVIQQGNIGAITDAGPEERRLFIEEAAGITRYKSRKTEALRKVQSTQQNLLRVSDIISEVHRQMNGLKRQARKAERFKEYQDHLREIDIILSLNYYDIYAEKIAETDALLDGLKDTDLERSSQLKKLDAAVEEIKLKRWQKNQEIADQKSSRFENQRKMDRAENDMAHLRQEVERLAAEVAELNSARAEINEKNQSIAAEITQVEEENSRLTGEIEKASAFIETERRQTEGIRNRLTALSEALDRRKADLMDLVAEEARYRNIYQNAEINKDSLRRRIKKADEEELLSKRQVAEARNHEARAREVLSGIKAAIRDLDDRIGSAQVQLDEKIRDLAEQVRRVQTLELERKECHSKHATLKKMEENFDWYRDGVKAIMTWKEGDRRPDGILGLMADLVEPDPSYETAVEAMLGETLQYVIVKDLETGSGAIDHLRGRGSGRSGFIPVTAMETEVPPAPIAGDRLLDHVRVKPGFEKIANAILGPVTLAESFSDALKQWTDGGRAETIVTKDGDIITHQGLLIGGSKENLAGILAKKQEIKALEGQFAVLDKGIEDAQRRQSDLEETVRKDEAGLQKLLEEKRQMGQEEIDAEKNMVKVSEELKQVERHLEIVRMEQEQLLGQESDIDDEIVRYNKVLAEIEKKVSDAQEEVARKTGEIQSVSRQMERFNQKLVDLQLQMTGLNASLENSNNTLRRLNEFKQDGILRLEGVSNEIGQKERRAEHSRKRIGEYEQMLGTMYAAMKDLDRTIEENEANYQAIDNQLRENDEEISTIRSQREELLQKIRLLEVEQSQHSVKQESIVNRLAERYRQSVDVLRRDFTGSEAAADRTVSELEEELEAYRKKIERIGDVNLGAIKEFEDLKTRFEFLTEQRDDLVKALEDLQKVIKKINRITRERFLTTFNAVNEKLIEVFPRLFEGGSASLVLTDPDDPLETGVEFMIHPPGKKLTRMSLLSGGEKALAAIAFIFSIFLIRPTSFCLMDEIDAPLDEANVYRFNDLLKIIGEKSQIIMVTHNKRSMEFADMLFGITMEKKGISKIVSVNLEGAESTQPQAQLN